MNNGKKATSVEEQIKIILKRTGEINAIESGIAKEKLSRFLNRYGYDSLIYRFENLIYSRGDAKKMKPGIKTNELINLFYFDREATNICSELISYIELLLKGQIKICIADFFDKNNISLRARYKNQSKSKEPLEFLHSKLQKINIKGFKNSFQNYKRSFKESPTILSLIDGLTLNELIVFLKCNSSHQITLDFFKRISLYLNKHKTNEEEIIKLLEYFRNIRNLVFHGHSILGKGNISTYIEKNKIIKWSSSKGNRRTNKNFFPLDDLLVITSHFNKKKALVSKAKINLLYWEYIFENGNNFLTLKELVGYIW